MQGGFVTWGRRILGITLFGVICVTGALFVWSTNASANARSVVDSSRILIKLEAVTSKKADAGIIKVLEIYAAQHQSTSTTPSNSMFLRSAFSGCSLRRDFVVRGLAYRIVQEANEESRFKNAIHRERIACELNRRFDRRTLGRVWLQKVYFGEGVYGVEAAAHHYFDLPISQLSDHQAAILVALIIAPNLSNADIETLASRGHTVLERMNDAR